MGGELKADGFSDWPAGLDVLKPNTVGAGCRSAHLAINPSGGKTLVGWIFGE